MATKNTFYYNGTSFTPKVYQVSPSYARHGLVAAAPAVSADATSINGSTSIDGTPSTTGGFSGMAWHDPTCLFGDETTGDFSIAFRWKLKTAGASQIGGFHSGVQSQSAPMCGLNINYSGTGYTVRLNDETSNAIIGTVNFAATISTATWYDAVVTYDNSTKTMEVFQDGTSLGTSVGGRYFGIGGLAVDPAWVANVHLADGVYSPTSNVRMDEWAMFNYVLDGTEVAFFTGAARAAYYGYTATVADTDPGIANVKLAETYYFDGALKTGTLESTDPGVANVVDGTMYKINSADLEGEYAATISTDPGIANVRTGTDYTIEGSALSGTYVPAEIAKYQEGQQYGAAGTEFTGTLNFNNFSPDNYTTVAQVKSMFRRIKIEDDTGDEDTNTVLTTEEVVQFMDDIDAEINAKLSAWYALPITGQKSLNLLNTISKWKVAHIVKTVLEVTNQNSDKQQDVQSNLEKKANKLLDEILPSYKNGRWLDPVSELPDAPRNAVSPKTGELFGKNYSGVRTPQIKKGGDNW